MYCLFDVSLFVVLGYTMDIMDVLLFFPLLNFL